MASDHKIDIRLTQTYDSASAARTAEQVQTSAQKNAAAITAAEEAESQKRVAIIQQEAKAKQEALNAVTPPPVSASSLPSQPSTASAEASTMSDAGAARLTQALERLRELMGDYQEQSEACVRATDDVRLAMENAAAASGSGLDAMRDYETQAEALAARQGELHAGMQAVAEGAAALAKQVADCTISSQGAETAAVALLKRNKDIVAGLQELKQEALRLQEGMQASIPVIEAEGEARRVALVKTQQASSRLKVLTRDVSGSIVRGFQAAGKAVSAFRKTVGRVTFAMAIMNEAWEMVSKLWEMLQSKHEAATKAAREHQETLQELFAESDRLLQEQMAATRKNRAEAVYKNVEAALVRVNEELERSVRLKNQDMALDMRRRRLSMSREAWELEKEEMELDDLEESGALEGWQAADRRADIRRRRARQEYEHGQEERKKRKESLDYEQNRTQIGLGDTRRSLEALQAWKDSGIRLYTPGQMKDFKARAEVRGGMTPEEKKAYNRNKADVRRLMERFDMGDMYAAWEWGDFDLAAELKKLEEKLRKQEKTLEERLTETGNKLDDITLSEEEAAAALQLKLERLQHEAERQKDRAHQKMKADDIDKEVKAETQQSAAAVREAQARSRKIREDNDQLIDSRLRSHEGESGLKELYDAVSRRGDDATIRRIVSELARAGKQVRWGRGDFETYGAPNLTQMVKLRGDDRQFWQERFQGLMDSRSLESQSKALQEASAAIREVASEHKQTIGQIGEGANALAEAYAEQLAEIQKLYGTLRKMINEVKTLKGQLHHTKW